MDAILIPNPAAAPGEGGFDFTWHMRRLCADVVARLEELAHVQLDRVAIRFCQTRKAVSHGMQASLTPLRFADGQTSTRRRGCQWGVQKIVVADGREMLYLLSFYLPRFLDLPLDEKFVTVVHELWHVGPAFDGDLRRHPGRCYAHSPSQQRYDAVMNQLAAKYRQLGPPEPLVEFLNFDFRQLQAAHGRVCGLRIPTPRLYRLNSANLPVG